MPHVLPPLLSLLSPLYSTMSVWICQQGLFIRCWIHQHKTTYQHLFNLSISLTRQSRSINNCMSYCIFDIIRYIFRYYVCVQDNMMTFISPGELIRASSVSHTLTWKGKKETKIFIVLKKNRNTEVLIKRETWHYTPWKKKLHYPPQKISHKIFFSIYLLQHNALDSQSALVLLSWVPSNNSAHTKYWKLEEERSYNVVNVISLMWMNLFICTEYVDHGNSLLSLVTECVWVYVYECVCCLLVVINCYWGDNTTRIWVYSVRAGTVYGISPLLRIK